MKKKILALLLVACTTFSCTACSTNSNQSAKEDSSITRSGQYKLDTDKLVTKLCDYKKIPITISGNYTTTDEEVESSYNSALQQLASSASTQKTPKEVTDHDVIQKDDIVKVDYTGYLGKKAFDGGAAKDVYLDVANNSEATQGTGFIDGFTADLPGKKVGEKVSSKMKFPKEYGNKDLAGKEVTFKFKIKGIYKLEEGKEVKPEEVTDDMVAQVYGAQYNIATKDQLKNEIKSSLNQQKDQTKYADTVSATKEYVIKNSKITVPKKYLDLRLKEYEKAFINENCKSTGLKEFAKNYGTSVKEIKSQWKKSQTEQIKFELAFAAIAKKEKIKVSDDEYNAYIQSLISNSNGTWSKENDVYKYFGAGNAKEGKTYIKALVKAQKTVDKVSKQAKVTEQPQQTTQGKVAQ